VVLVLTLDEAPLRGALFENLVVIEALKNHLNVGKDQGFSFLEIVMARFFFEKYYLF